MNSAEDIGGRSDRAPPSPQHRLQQQPHDDANGAHGSPADRPPFYPRKVLKFPSLKRNRDNAPLNEKVKLERVLGFTITGNACLTCDPNTGTIIYPAGCTVVLYNPRKNRQTHILNASKKTITSLDVSPDGRYIITGECGHLPNVRIWDSQEKVQVAEFTGHKFGINCVAFSPNLKYVVSVGSQHDMIVNVWDWRSGIKVASNKVSSKVKAVAFSEAGNYFVTVGNRHVKFWYLECSARPSKYKEPVPLMGRSAILGEKRNNYFCDVACGKGDMSSSTFSITKSGLLCEFNNRRLLDKWVELRTQSANCLTAGRSLIFIGCADGIIRCFSPYTLDFVTTLPRTHYLGVDVSMGLSISHMSTQVPKAKYPDTVAISYDETNRKVTCVYRDHSMYIWDVKDIKKVGKSHSFLYHSACIWGVEMYPQMQDSQKPVLPPGSFITCSSDDTIRVWNLDPQMPSNTVYRKNIYCGDLLKIVYVDDELSYLCDFDRNPGGSTDKMDATYDTKNGVRCIRISPDGHQLASGDRSGNIRIHELQRMDEICKIEAHDAEVLNLEYSKPDTDHRFLASASRDRLIHVFDVDQDYSFQQTLDDHSSSITSVRFVQTNKQLQMISCGADKSIIFRTAQYNPQLQFVRDHHVVGKTTLYDMEVDLEQKHIMTACQDRHVRVYSVANGKHERSFKGSLGEDGTLIKVVLDGSGLFAATSCTDKNLCIYDFVTNECVATMFGHSEIVTGLRFTSDCKHLISVSGDSCIFVWKLPLEITHQMQIRMAQMAPKMRHALRKAGTGSPTRQLQKNDPRVNESFGAAHPDIFNANTNEVDDGGVTDYRFSVGPLPKWAKKEIDSTSVNPAEEKVVGIAEPKGRWAQRIDTQGMMVRSFYSSDHVIPYPGQATTKTTTTKESIRETEYHKYTDVRRETFLVGKQQEEGSGGGENSFTSAAESLEQIRYGAPSPGSRSTSSPLTVSTRRGAEMAAAAAASVTRRRTPVGTNSPVGSSMQVVDLDNELHYHDGDAEDEESLETDHSTEMEIQEVIYYPSPEESFEDGERDFKVTATNQDELRDAHRRTKKGRSERPSDLPIIQVHDSDDDEDSGTPQGGEQSIMTMFSMSMENLERVGQREKFMKSTYESLEGDAGADSKEEEGSSITTTTGIGSSLTDEGEQSEDHRHSISARYQLNHTPSSSTPLRTKAVINASKQKNEVVSQRRKEIMRQLEQSRKKLDTIGWKASLNNSKSIGDLTDLPEKDYADGRHFFSKDSASALDTMRRASSMNDLSKPRRLLPPPPTDAAPSRTFGARLGDRNNRDAPSRPSTSMSRSSSMGTLNPSESDSDAPSVNTSRSSGGPSSLSRWGGGGGGGGSSMRPTISSINKAVGLRGSQEQLSSRLSAKPSTVAGRRQEAEGRRRGASVSVDTRRAAAAGASDSSSGENSPTETRAPLRGGLGPPGHTATLPRHHGRSGMAYSLTQASSRSRSEKDLSKVGGGASKPDVPPRNKPEVPPRRSATASSPYSGGRVASAVQRLTNGISGERGGGHMLEKSPQELPVKDNFPQPIDVISEPISRELCEATAQGLKQAADNILQLYKRVSMDSDLLDGDRSEMLSMLCDSAAQAEQTMRPINRSVGSNGALSDQSPSSGKISDASDMPMLKVSSTNSPGVAPLLVGPRVPAAAGGTGNDQMHLLQQYSDMLFNMVQQRMGSQV